MTADSLIRSSVKLNAAEKQGIKSFASAFTEHARLMQDPPSYIDGFSDSDESNSSERRVAELFMPTPLSTHSSDNSE